MQDIKKPSKVWTEYKKRKEARDKRLASWRDGIIVILVTLLGMIEI